MHQQDSFPALYWIYLHGTGLVAAGFAYYPPVAYHWVKHHTDHKMDPDPYAVEMAVGGGARLFGRSGFKVLIGLTPASRLFVPRVFLGRHSGLVILGAAVWGKGMGVHESIIPAAVAQSKRASAFGTFSGVHRIWFAGSAVVALDLRSVGNRGRRIYFDYTSDGYPGLYLGEPT